MPDSIKQTERKPVVSTAHLTLRKVKMRQYIINRANLISPLLTEYVSSVTSVYYYLCKDYPPWRGGLGGGGEADTLRMPVSWSGDSAGVCRPTP